MIINRSVVDIVSDYELSPRVGLVSVVVPIARTNLVTNPSYETNTTGYTMVDGATIIRTTEDQRRGVYSAKVKPGLASTSGLYFTTSALTAGNAYAYSLDVNIRGGQKYVISVFDGIRTVAQKKITGKGYWERVYLVFSAVTTGAHRLYLNKDGHADTNVFYTDGWQLELCATGEVWPTTYIDGDLLGFVANQQAYYWNGTPHASTSTRIANTRAGGRIVNLLDLGFRVLAMVGLGFSPITNVSTQYGLIDGSLYQRTVVRSRPFTVVGHVNGSSYQELMTNRQSITDVMSPDSTGIRQPLTLIYQQVDEQGNVNGEALEIVCSYNAGLESSINNLNAERIGLQFIAYDPYLAEQGDHGSLLTFSSDVTNANKIVKLSKATGWSEVIGGFSGLGNVDALLYANGVLYAGGTSTAGLQIFDFATNTRTIKTGFDGAIRTMAASPDGSIIYIGGNFTTAGGVASPGVAAYTVATGAFSAIGSAISGGGGVYALSVAPDGTLYVGGQFTTISGLTVSGIARRSAAGVWSKLTTGSGIGVGTIAQALEIGSDGYLYIGGTFQDIDGVTQNFIARYNLSTQVYSAMSSGMNLDVYSFAIGANGLLYIGGDFTTSGGITTNGLATWNGISFSPLGTGVSHPSNAIVRSIEFTPQGELYIVGSFTSADGISVPSGMAVWNGSTLRPVAIDLPAGESLFAVEVDDLTGDVYFGYNTSGTANAAGSTTIDYNGTSVGYPTIKIVGPGTLYQIANLTNNKYIFFNALTLLTGETMTVITQPGKVNISSNFRPSLLGFVSPASDIAAFTLQPGDNIVSTFLDDASGAAAVLMKWKNNHHGLGGSIRRGR